MELRINDYVRTNKGEFGKVTSVAKENLGFGDMEFCNTEPYVYGDIVKSSPNIIDLIEIGDYVNGEKVTKVVLDSIECNYIELDYTYNRHSIRNKDIKSIVTKEMYSSVEYRVESN